MTNVVEVKMDGVSWDQTAMKGCSKSRTTPATLLHITPWILSLVYFFFYFELFAVLNHAMIDCSYAFITGGVDKNSTTNLPHQYISQNSDKIPWPDKYVHKKRTLVRYVCDCLSCI